mgnify:CR=1 FL=1
MSVVETLLDRANEHQKDFVLIGGHAVNALGIARATHDLDFAVRDDDKSWWGGQLLSFGYTVVNQQKACIQTRGPLQSSWAIDLMLLDNETMDRLIGGSSEILFLSKRCRLPAPKHLLAMKFHALNSPGRRTDNKDMDDIVGIVEKYGITAEDLETLAERYGKKELLDEIKDKLPY